MWDRDDPEGLAKLEARMGKAATERGEAEVVALAVTRSANRESLIGSDFAWFGRRSNKKLSEKDKRDSLFRCAVGK